MMDMLRFRQNLFEQQHNSNNNSMKMEIDNFLDQNNNLNLDSAWPSALDRQSRRDGAGGRDETTTTTPPGGN
uniref:Uncharacterized protein n=1 Tax=Trichogramma kaykai TaxID=54128 RepID=A0ABD2WWS4_9HYME